MKGVIKILPELNHYSYLFYDGVPEHLFCVYVRYLLNNANPVTGLEVRYSSSATNVPISHTVGVLPGIILKELVYREVVTEQTDLVIRMHAACTSVDIELMFHVDLSIPQRAQACLDLQGGIFEPLPLQIFENTAIDMCYTVVT
ncbi:hypothetical protein TNCV_3877671 [Trichonephila clavipes]|uniref:Uncharacterized protein n=1 Tax=Trichonephila clavipes TaxID=2585209 RepID=A0A8X6SS98_TRICX|nr:hypothetical protein TNCV_3877671 [Trichonephila clavipes]